MPLTRTVGSYVTYPLGHPDQAIDWEDFIVTRNPDGSRTAMSLSRFPGCAIVRHVTQTVDSDFIPRDGFVRLFSDNIYLGALVRHVSGDTVTSIVLPPDGGPVDESSFPIDRAQEVLGYHPTTAEGWKLMKLDRTVSGVQTIRLLTTSLTWNGGTISHGRKVEMPVEYLGRENITVAGKVMNCHHYMWRTGDIDGDLEIWTTGEDEIVARMNGYRKGHAYELSRYDVTDFSDEREFGY